MQLLKTIQLAMQDAARAERLMADERFVRSLRRYPTAALRTFALAHVAARPESELRRVERNVLLQRIA
jgi:hypothetical protein